MTTADKSITNWKSALVSPNATLEQAISVIDAGALGIAIVVDDHQRLLGTLTDGDIRRALLRHLSLDIAVGDVMCKSPKTAHHDWNRERIMSVMRESRLLQLPVIDACGRVVGLETLPALLNQREFNNAVFLMAGGYGTRLHPLTQDCPKPLLRVGGKPILERILTDLIKFGFHRFFISTHYLSEMVSNYFGDGSQWGVSIRYTHETFPLGTGGALGLLPHSEINEPIIVMNGDLLTTLNYQELLEFHIEQESVATLCVRKFEYKIPYGVVNNEGSKVRTIIEKPTHDYFINAGVYVLSPELVKSVQPGTNVDMPALLDSVIKKGESVSMFPVHEYWLDIGRMEDFHRAQLEVPTLPTNEAG